MEFKTLFVIIFSIVFFADLIYKNFYERKTPKPQKEISSSNKSKSELIDENSNKLNINNTNVHHNLHNLNKQDESIKNTEENNTASQNINLHYINYENLDIDSDEFEGEIEKQNPIISMKILYDPKLYKNLVDTYSKYLIGNYSTLNVDKKEFPLDHKQKILTTGLFIFEVTFFFIVMGSNIFKNHITFIPQKVFVMLNKLRFIITGLFVFLHQFYIKKFSYTYAFEIYIKDSLKYSGIRSKTPPSYDQITNILREFKLFKNN